MSIYKFNININQNKSKNVTLTQHKTTFGLTLNQRKVNIDLSKSINVLTVSQDHSQLTNLDFEHSGHIGFASIKDLEDYVPKKLSILPQVEKTSDRSSILIYADDNGKSCSISMKEMLSKKIRTSASIPSDLQAGEYLFLERKEN